MLPASPAAERMGLHAKSAKTDAPLEPCTQVYLATWDETPVAAKALVPLRAGLHGYKAVGSLTERELQRFHRECSTLASVSHPNVVQVRGAGHAVAGVLAKRGCKAWKLTALASAAAITSCCLACPAASRFYPHTWLSHHPTPFAAAAPVLHAASGRVRVAGHHCHG